MFAAYGALVFWLSRAVTEQKRRDGEEARNKDPDEFKRILTHLQKHSFYLNPRALDLR